MTLFVRRRRFGASAMKVVSADVDRALVTATHAQFVFIFESELRDFPSTTTTTVPGFGGSVGRKRVWRLRRRLLRLGVT